MTTILEQIQYGFDPDSRRTWQKRALSTTQDQHYSYDALSQVSAAARGSLNLNFTAISGVPAAQESWDYDPTGNWRGYRSAANGVSTLDQHRVHDRGNRLTQIEDNPNNMILDRVGRMRQMAPDAGGDWDGRLEITWDAWSRITSVKNNGAVVGEYSYDGTHRRITREVGGETLHSYYNDAWRPVEERKDAETTASISYLWGARHRDDLVRRDRVTSGTTLDETRYVLMDYFNPAAVTDEEGGVTERYAFSAFGVRTILNPDFTARSSSECGMEFAFQGQFLDIESGLMNYGFRYYSPYLGRWTCKDPIEEDGGSNLYEMAGNTCVNQVDHLGLIAVDFTPADNDPGPTNVTQPLVRNPGWTTYTNSFSCECKCDDDTLKWKLTCKGSLSAAIYINVGYRGPSDLGNGAFDQATVYGHEQRHINTRNTEADEKLNNALGGSPDTFDQESDCEEGKGSAESTGKGILDAIKNGTSSPYHQGMPGYRPGQPQGAKPYNPQPGSKNAPPYAPFPNAK